jgi:hypothetical protein
MSDAPIVLKMDGWYLKAWKELPLALRQSALNSIVSNPYY